jgi:hypothetical protein
VYGGGKEGTVEEKDVVGWTRDRQHIYSDDKTTALVTGLTAGAGQKNRCVLMCLLGCFVCSVFVQVASTRM